MSDDVDARRSELRRWYDGYVYKCRIFEDRFYQHLQRALRNTALDDAKLETRTKSVESLLAKATKQMPTGEFKYVDPKTEITDLVGARIQVPLSTDLSPVVTMLKQTYVIEEELERGEEEGHVDIPGYRSLHFLVRLSEVDLRDVDLREFGDMTVEIQVRTTLQHAWASLQHDLMYKSERAPSPTIRRRLIALAGLLELADREFVSVRQAHSEVRDSAPRAMESSSATLTASALRHLTETLFDEEDPASQAWFVELRSVLDALGISTADELSDVLGPWADKAPRVAVVVRTTKPWVNSAYLLDVLLRLALREQYIQRHRPDTDDERLPADEIDALTTEFIAEVDAVERAVAST